MPVNIALRGKSAARPSFRMFYGSRRRPNAFAMTIMLLPLTLLVAAALTATVRRTVVDFLDPVSGEFVSRESATAQAERVAVRVLNAPFRVTEASRNVAYSRWRKNSMPSWDVYGISDAGTYLVRVNGLTGRVFGFNRIVAKTNKADQGDLLSGIRSATGETARRQAAEQEARRRLKAFGMSLPNFLSRRHSMAWNMAMQPCDIFVYSYMEAGMHARTVTICLNREDGALEQIWNAAGSH